LTLKEQKMSISCRKYNIKTMFFLSPLIETRRRPFETTKSAIDVNTFPSIEYLVVNLGCHACRWETAVFPLVSSRGQLPSLLDQRKN
jgi:NADH:ubiquinone oxidoreductase subunit H